MRDKSRTSAPQIHFFSDHHHFSRLLGRSLPPSNTFLYPFAMTSSSGSDSDSDSDSDPNPPRRSTRVSTQETLKTSGLGLINFSPKSQHKNVKGAQASQQPSTRGAKSKPTTGSTKTTKRTSLFALILLSLHYAHTLQFKTLTGPPKKTRPRLWRPSLPTPRRVARQASPTPTMMRRTMSCTT